MVIITLSYDIKVRLLGITLIQQNGRTHHRFTAPPAGLPLGVLFDEPLHSVGRGIRLGVRVEVA